MRRLLVLALLLCGCVPREGVAPTPVRTSPTPAVVVPLQPRSQWTLVFYFAADNDLEEAEMRDLEELTRLPASPKVRILALVDRSPLGEPSEGYSHRAVVNQANWSHAKLLEVTGDKLIERDDWGQLNMADPQSLRRLLQLSQERYPADRYALFLVDHGHAWTGLCSDDSASQPDDRLDLRELREVLKGLSQPVDLLALDACMMSSLELYAAVAPYTRFIVASQDTLPGQGLDYLSALKRLARKPEADGRQLGRWFLDGYRQSVRQDPHELSRLQLTLLDSQAEDALRHAWQKLAESLKARVERNWVDLARARAAAQAFQEDDGAEMHDLGQLLNGLQRAGLEVGAVRKLLAAAVVDQARGRFRSQCSGLSVFFPPQADSDYFSALEPFLGEWVGFLKEYTQAEHPGGPVLSEVSLSGGQRIDLQARLGREVARSYTILVQDHKVVGQMTCATHSTVLNDFFDGHWLALQEGGNTLLAQLESVEFESPQSATALATVPCQLKRKDGNSFVPVQLYFALEPEELERPGRLVGAVRGGSLGAVDVKLSEGDQLAFLQRDLRPGGHHQRGPTLTLKHPSRLSLRLAPVPPGDYELGFLVVDLRGVIHSQTRPLMWGE